MSLRASEVVIKKLDNHTEGIFGFRNIGVVEESMKKSFPNMKLGINAKFH